MGAENVVDDVRIEYGMRGMVFTAQGEDSCCIALSTIPVSPSRPQPQVP